MYGGHVAYGVRPEYRGAHFAGRALRLLMPLARRHGLCELWITCNPENIASRRTCEFAGAELIGIVDLPPETDMYQEGERQNAATGWTCELACPVVAAFAIRDSVQCALELVTIE